MEGLEKFEAQHCQTCGFHESLTDLDAHNFAIETPVCPVCQYRDRYERRQTEADDKYRASLGEKPPADRKDPADGRRIIIRYTGKAKPPAE